jgi:hypothetical protein
LFVEQKNALVLFNKKIKNVYEQSCFSDCQNMEMEPITNGPCNCFKCCTATSVTVPQVQFRKCRRDGYIETAHIYKEFRLVVNKRKLVRAVGSSVLPFGNMTLPMGHMIGNQSE